MSDSQKVFVMVLILLAYVITTMRFLFNALITGSSADAYAGFGMIGVLLLGVFVILGKEK